MTSPATERVHGSAGEYRCVITARYDAEKKKRDKAGGREGNRNENMG